MTRTRGIGILAAIGGLTAIVAVQTGLPVAKADEMADLRANQLLLQQRIDQLAQATKQFPGQTGASAYGNVAAPTAPSLGGSFPRSFLIPGTDTSVRVGGFVDLTILDFLQGGGNVNGTNYGSNSGQNGNRALFAVGRRVRPRSRLCQPERDRSGARAQQRRPRIQPAAIAVQHRDPHPDLVGRGAHVFRVGLGRLQQFQLPGRRSRAATTS